MTSPVLAPDIALLPKRGGEEHPLMIIITIMACLAGLTLLFSLTGFRTSQSWQDDNARAMTVQIIPDTSVAEHEQKLISRVSQIIKSVLPGAEVTPISHEEARKMLQPWIGNVGLPEDLPLPLLLKVKTAQTDINTEALRQALAQANIESVVDDHSRWRKNIHRTWQTVQTVMWGIIILVLTASGAVICYAARSVLRARQSIIDVLIHVGAADRYIVSLFTGRFFMLGFKAAFIGAALAVLGWVVFSMQTKTMAADILPHTDLRVADLFWLSGLVAAFAVLSALTAILTTLTIIKNDRKMS